jgi:hypothetical protein
MSTHPGLNTLMSQIVMKIGTYSNFGPKIPNFLFSRKSDKQIKSYDPVNFRVDTTTRIVQTAVDQKLLHLETSSWCHSLTN